MQSFELGAGLIGIGREWGAPEPKQPPGEEDVRDFLEFTAGETEIRFFDTAPAYGMSEERLGSFLWSLTDAERERLFIATKVGEEWDVDSRQGYPNHDLLSMMRSLQRSKQRLGKINLLQLHQSTPELVQSEEVRAVFDEARTAYGVDYLGVSLKDIETAEAVADDDFFDTVQLPYNQDSTHLRPVLEMAAGFDWDVIINRPMQMGRVTEAKDGIDKRTRMKDAYSFLRDELGEIGVKRAVVLTGTSKIPHLIENLDANERAWLDIAKARLE